MWVSLGKDIKINIDVLYDIIEKAKKYIRPGVSPPKGVVIHTGKRGGKYYIIEDRHMKFNNQHHELVRSVGVRRDQWEQIKNEFLKQGAQSVEFIPQPEYGKREGDDTPLYNMYVNWGQSTQEKIEAKLAADKEKYAHKKVSPESSLDSKDIEWKDFGKSHTFPYLKQIGNKSVPVGEFRIDEMYHGVKLYYTGPDGEKHHLASAFQQSFKWGTDEIDEEKSRKNNLKVLKGVVGAINDHGDSQLTAIMLNQRRINREKEEDKKKEKKPKKEPKLVNPLKELQWTMSEIRSGKIDPHRNKIEATLQQEKGDLDLKEFLVKKLATLYPDETPERLADAAMRGAWKFDQSKSLSDSVHAGQIYLSNVKPVQKRPTVAPKVTLPPIPDHKEITEKLDSILEQQEAKNPDKRPLEEKLKTLHVPKKTQSVQVKAPKMKRIGQYTSRDGAERAAVREQKAGYTTEIQEKKLGTKLIFNLYGRKPKPGEPPKDTPVTSPPAALDTPQVTTVPTVMVPHSDIPGQRGWLRQVTAYNPEFNLNSGEFVKHDSIENGNKKFTLNDGIYESGQGPKYKMQAPKYYHVQNGELREIDTREYQNLIRKLPYVNAADILSKMHADNEAKPKPSEPFDKDRYAKDKEYQKQIDAQLSSNLNKFQNPARQVVVPDNLTMVRYQHNQNGDEYTYYKDDKGNYYRPIPFNPVTRSAYYAQRHQGSGGKVVAMKMSVPGLDGTLKGYKLLEKDPHAQKRIKISKPVEPDTEPVAAFKEKMDTTLKQMVSGKPPKDTPPATPVTPPVPSVPQEEKLQREPLHEYHISGNTYEHKDLIRQAGGKYDKEHKRWIIQEGKATDKTDLNSRIEKLRNLPGLQITEPEDRTGPAWKKDKGIRATATG